MRKYLPYLFLFFIFNVLILKAQNLDYFAGARSAGMAHSTVALSDFWALYHNQGAMAFAENIEIGTSLENKFGVSDLNMGHLGAIVPTNNFGVIGISAAHLNMQGYNESKLGLAYARRLSTKIGFGLKINYHNYSVAEQGNFSNLTFETGILYKYSNKLNFGFHVFNPTQSRRVASVDDYYPIVLRMGAEYLLSKKLHVLFEVQKDDMLPVQIKGGLEWMLGEILYLRTGLANNPQWNTFGMGIQVKDFRLDLALGYVARLGASPQIGLQYAL